MPTPVDGPQLLARLPRASWTRRMLGDGFARGAPAAWVVDALCASVRDRSGWYPRDRAAMCWYLRHVPEGDRQRAAVAACDVVNRSETWHMWRVVRALVRVQLVLLAAFATPVVLCLIAIGSYYLRVGSPLLGQFIFDRAPILWSFVASRVFVIVTAASTFLASLWVEDRHTQWCRQVAVESLGALAAPASASTLARIAMAGRGGVRRAAEEAIFPVLRSITTEHYGPLDEAVPAICELLHHTSISMRLAALEALGRFAGGRAVEPVNDLTFEANPPEIAEALARVLPILRERQRQERAAASLLRPSQAPTTAADALLRPAPGAPADDPALLLRSVEAPDPDAMERVEVIDPPGA